MHLKRIPTWVGFATVLLNLQLTAAFGQVREAWVARYGNGEAQALAVDSAGNVYVTGGSLGSGPGFDYATLKYDADGNLIWERRYNGPGNGSDMASAVAVDSARNVYVAGRSLGLDSALDYATLKYDPDGNLIWERRYNGPGNGSDTALAVAVDSAGNVHVTGASLGSDSGFDYATLKYDADGNLLWEQRYNGPGNADDGARRLAVDSAGNVYVTGGSTGSGSGRDYATLKHDPDGNLLWEQRYNGPGNADDGARGLAVDSAGNVYLTGESVGSGGFSDYATLKYDLEGNLLWAQRYDGPGSRSDFGSALVLDGAGNVYVTGGSLGSDSGFDYATLKYDADGNLIWEQRYDGPRGYDEARALAVDSAGNVYVTGLSNLYGYFDYATVKYQPDGTLLWVRRYDAGDESIDMAVAVAVDSTGSVYVTGSSAPCDPCGCYSDYATIKYVQERFPGPLTGKP